MNVQEFKSKLDELQKELMIANLKIDDLEEQKYKLCKAHAMTIAKYKVNDIVMLKISKKSVKIIDLYAESDNKVQYAIQTQPFVDETDECFSLDGDAIISEEEVLRLA